MNVDKNCDKIDLQDFHKDCKAKLEQFLKRFLGWFLITIQFLGAQATRAPLIL